MKRYKKRQNTNIALLILAVSICVMFLSGFKLREAQQIYQISDESYKSLADRARPAGPPVFSESQNTAGSSGGQKTKPAEQVRVNIPDMTIDFDILHSINEDIVAWIYCPDTMIDYPIVRATEYDYYLHRLPDGTFNANGTLFIDYNWKDFSDRFLIVYGHNMKSGRMFGSLSNYKRQEYFNAHPYLYLYTEQGEKYRIELMYGCVIGAGQWRDRAFMFDVNMDSLLAYAAHNTTFSSDIQYTQGDKIITLSTCSYEFDGARYVVIGVLRPEYH